MLIETTSIWSCHVIDQYGAEGPRECRAVEGGQASCHDMLQSPNLDAGYPQDADLRSSPPPRAFTFRVQPFGTPPARPVPQHRGSCAGRLPSRGHPFAYSLLRRRGARRHLM